MEVFGKIFSKNDSLFEIRARLAIFLQAGIIYSNDITGVKHS